MPYHTCIIDDLEYEVDFEITNSGCPSNGWDEPGWAPEIEINSVTFGEVDVPYHKGTKDIYDKLNTQVVENFNFADWYAGMEDC